MKAQPLKLGLFSARSTASLLLAPPPLSSLPSLFAAAGQLSKMLIESPPGTAVEPVLATPPAPPGQLVIVILTGEKALKM